MATKKRPFVIDHVFFRHRAQVAFQITYEGRKDKLPEYDRMQTAFWKVSEEKNVIWGKTNEAPLSYPDVFNSSCP